MHKGGVWEGEVLREFAGEDCYSQLQLIRLIRASHCLDYLAKVVVIFLLCRRCKTIEAVRLYRSDMTVNKSGKLRFGQGANFGGFNIAVLEQH